MTFKYAQTAGIFRQRGAYKYTLTEQYDFDTGIKGYTACGPNGIVTLSPDGLLHIAKGYAWDGPSGPAIDTESFMRSSCLHDALYQLISLDLLPPDVRVEADRILRDVSRDDGMWYIRSLWVYAAVRIFGALYVTRPH